MNKDKVIILTGSEGLLGKEMAIKLAGEGAKVIRADISLQTDLTDNRLHLDVTDPEQVRKAIDLVYEHFEKIDGLVNNAYPRTKDWGTGFEQLTLQSWTENINFQLNSVFYMSQQVFEKMKIASQGSIVNIGSIYGILGNDFTLYEDTKISPPPPYSAIKGGIVNFTRFMASYAAKYGIRVNCVSPGGVFDHQDEAFVEKYARKVPMKRMANPEEIAPAVSFLLSDDASYITGQNLVVDGGYSII